MGLLEATPFQPVIKIWLSFMEIRKFSVQLGRNRWFKHQVFDLVVDLSELEGRTLGEIPGYVELLLEHLPEPDAYVPARNDVIKRLAALRDLSQPAISLPENLSRIVLGLACCESDFGKTESNPSGHRVILGFQDEDFDRSCVGEVFERLGLLLAGSDSAMEGWLEPLLERANRARLGPSSLSIVCALQEQGVPFKRLNTGSLIQLGWGARQRRIWTAQTDRPAVIASDISCDKELTRRLLMASGVPVSEGRVVVDEADAWKTSQELGGPVVVKPRDGNHADGVSIGLTTQTQIETAFRLAASHRPNHTSDVIVERVIPGVEHRVLIIDGKMVAAYRGQPARVLGDGVHSVNQLVDIENKDPRRGRGWLFPLDTIKIDKIACLVLDDQGYSPDSVPFAGISVDLTRSADMATDVTDEVHPEVVARTVEAARVVGLDIAGIDLVTPDIRRPLEEQGGAIVEVNAGPGLMCHLHPAVGKPRPVGKAIADILFKHGDRGRIPIVAVYAQVAGSGLAQKIARTLESPGCGTGLVCGDGVFLNSRRIHANGFPMSKSLQDLITSPLLDLVVVEVNPDDVLSHGLGFDEAGLVVIDLADSERVHDQAATLLLESLVPETGSLIVWTDEVTAKDWAERAGVDVIWVEPKTQRVQHGFGAGAGARAEAVEGPVAAFALKIVQVLKNQA